MRNRIPIGMGTSLLGGAGLARPGSTLGTIESLSEQANAQTLHDHPDTDPSQLLALNTNLLPSVFWDKDQTSLKLPNPDGATSFFVNQADTDAMPRVLDGEVQGLAQAGITAIDFTAGQVRYADGHSDALTAQLLTGETSGVKLTKVYEVVDGQQVDLHAGEVLESEGYQGQDADAGGTRWESEQKQHLIPVNFALVAIKSVAHIRPNHIAIRAMAANESLWSKQA